MVPYYFNYGRGGTYPTDWYTPCSTTTPYEWSYGYTTVTTYTYQAPILPPKNWRWFDIFREWEVFTPVIPTPYVANNIRRVQERFPIRQRTQQKRRAAVQKMRAPLTGRL